MACINKCLIYWTRGCTEHGNKRSMEILAMVYHGNDLQFSGTIALLSMTRTMGVRFICYIRMVIIRQRFVLLYADANLVHKAYDKKGIYKWHSHMTTKVSVPHKWHSHMITKGWFLTNDIHIWQQRIGSSQMEFTYDNKRISSSQMAFTYDNKRIRSSQMAFTYDNKSLSSSQIMAFTCYR